MARPTRRLDGARGYALVAAVTSSKEGGTLELSHGGEKKCWAIKYESSVLSLPQGKFHGLDCGFTAHQWLSRHFRIDSWMDRLRRSPEI